jgi:hypothetical protein
MEIFIKNLLSEQCGQQNIHTPFELCRTMIVEANEYVGFREKQIAILFNVEFLHVFVKDYEIPSQQITIFVDYKREFEFCRMAYGMVPDVNLFYIDMENTIKEDGLYTTTGGRVMKKFDVILMNPPYQSKSEQGRTHPLWHKFVSKSIELCGNGGYVVNVHPSGWRNVDGKFKEIQQLLKSKQMLYLEMHHFQEGQKVFGVAIDFDWHRSSLVIC